MYRSRGFVILLTAIIFGCCVAVFHCDLKAGDFVPPPGRWQLDSPDGKLSLQIAMKGDTVVYSVLRDGEGIIADSRLGVLLKENLDWSRGWTPSLQSVKKTDISRSWKPVCGERTEIPDIYSTVTIPFQRTDGARRTEMSVECRAYNEGIAFRYCFRPLADSNSHLKSDANEPGKGLEIIDEKTEFRFPDGCQCWPVSSAQGRYEHVPLNKMQKGAHRPLLVELPDGPVVSIGEAACLDYARTLFTRGDLPNTVKTLPGSHVSLDWCHPTPWRFVMVADRPGQLVERNYFLLNLNEPSKIADTSWIKPGKVIREVTLTTKGGKSCVDFAKKMNLQYIEYDAGWYGHEYDDSSDATTVTLDPKRNPDPASLDLHEVIRYAKANGIGVLVYVNRRALEKQLDELLPLYKKWGIAGIKYGFVNVGSQQWTAWLHDAIAKAAKYQMIIDIHDEYRTTGNERTYPNLLTVEGIGGDETQPSPEDNCRMAILRNLCGPGDHTFCWYQKGMKRTWSHQLAAPIVFYSPLTFLYWYDRPNLYPDETPELEVWKELPTVWDETRVLADRIGEQVTFARRSGNRWFVGALNAVEQRTLSIPLNYLDPNVKYEAKIFSDGAPDGSQPHNVRRTVQTVDSNDTLQLPAAANGGAAIILAPVKR